MTTIPITNGDTTSTGGNTGIALAIPNRLSQFVAVFDGAYGTYTIVFDAYGNCGSYTIVERVDTAREAWDSLNVHPRARRPRSCGHRPRRGHHSLRG